MASESRIGLGIDVGTECVKAVVLDEQGTLRGNAIKPRSGYFQDRISEILTAVLDDASVAESDLAGICATGFAENCVSQATTFLGETACHARGAFHFHPEPMCVIDLGGRDPKVIHVNERGVPTAIHTLRRCAAGIGTFLIFAARQLDIHPTRMQELANMADQPADVGSYCSIFAGQDILEKLRDGATREEIALGCLHSIAERVMDIGNLAAPVRVTGGVAEYFPGVLQILSERAGVEVSAVPQPILAGAVGAALWALKAARPQQEEGEAR